MSARFSIRAGIIAAVLAFCSIAVTPAASAAPAVELYCEPVPGAYWCQVTYSGGWATTRWYKNSTYMSLYDNKTFIRQSCNSGNTFTIRVVVTNELGTGEDSWGVLCGLMN